MYRFYNFFSFSMLFAVTCSGFSGPLQGMEATPSHYDTVSSAQEQASNFTETQRGKRSREEEEGSSKPTGVSESTGKEEQIGQSDAKKVRALSEEEQLRFDEYREQANSLRSKLLSIKQPSGPNDGQKSLKYYCNAFEIAREVHPILCKIRDMKSTAPINKFFTQLVLPFFNFEIYFQVTSLKPEIDPENAWFIFFCDSLRDEIDSNAELRELLLKYRLWDIDAFSRPGEVLTDHRKAAATYHRAFFLGAERCVGLQFDNPAVFRVIPNELKNISTIGKAFEREVRSALSRVECDSLSDKLKLILEYMQMNESWLVVSCVLEEGGRSETALPHLVLKVEGNSKRISHFWITNAEESLKRFSKLLGKLKETIKIVCFVEGAALSNCRNPDVIAFCLNEKLCKLTDQLIFKLCYLWEERDKNQKEARL